MSRGQRVTQRIVEERVPIERCDRCGTEGELQTTDGFFHGGSPKGWFALFTPNDREMNAQGFVASHSFCSIGCVERFAAELMAP